MHSLIDVFEWSDVDFLYRFVKAYKPNTILEIGSGHSTVAMTRALIENGFGYLTSIESEKTYAQKTLSLFPETIDPHPCSILIVKPALKDNAWVYESKDIAPHYTLVYVDGPPCEEDQYTTIPCDYRYLIIDGRKKTVEQIKDPYKPIECEAKPLSVFIKS